uniref:Venom peptide ECTX1-Rm14a n=1 Tax=Rhytidoponera metallica TaxID=148364 RepID=A0A8U0LTG5_RHYMT|nr:venom peptide precursor ECTX1-Rm14a [Rhytidoponera metallica]
MKRIYFLFAIIAIVVLTAQAFSEADAEAEALDVKDLLKKLCAKIPDTIPLKKKLCPK